MHSCKKDVDSGEIGGHSQKDVVLKLVRIAPDRVPTPVQALFAT